MWVCCKAERRSTPPVWGAVDSLATWDLQRPGLVQSTCKSHLTERPAGTSKSRASLCLSPPPSTETLSERRALGI